MSAMRMFSSAARRKGGLRQPRPVANDDLSMARTPAYYNQYQQTEYTQQHQHQQHHDQTAPLNPPRPLVLGLMGYVAIVNATAAGLFFYDKQQALCGGWRVPERQLQLTALLGGWPAGMWAMEKFRHKTTKKAFREPYFMAVAANMIISAGLVGGWLLVPRLRASFISSARRSGLGGAIY